jgi:hypothetical protein
MLKAPYNKFYFIDISRRELQINDGLKFTYKIHGFKSESIITSNPNISKHFFNEFNFLFTF